VYSLTLTKSSNIDFIKRCNHGSVLSYYFGAQLLLSMAGMEVENHHVLMLITDFQFTNSDSQQTESGEVWSVIDGGED